MTLPLRLPTPKPPPPSLDSDCFDDDFDGIEQLDRPQLDDEPDTDRMPILPELGWDEDNESGIVARRNARGRT